MASFEAALKAMRKGKIVRWDRHIFWIDKEHDEIVSQGWVRKDITDMILSSHWVITDRKIENDENR